jgi:hypothetical protein
MGAPDALPSESSRRPGLFEIYFAARSHVRVGESVGDMGGRRVIHFGGPSFCLQAGVSFGPRWEDGVFLDPMNEGGFIAPVKKFAHGATVGSGEHESLHLHFGSPESGGPEGATAVAKQPGGEIAVGARGLPRGSERVEKEHGKKAPRAHAKSSDGDERHVRQLRLPDGWPKRRRALCEESPCLRRISRN